MTTETRTISPAAIVVDDEPLLRESLCRQLNELWPELRIVDTAANGKQAMASLAVHTPDMVFLDVKMPGHTGIEVAQAIVEEWPDERIRPPIVVFVTAYDEFAVEAFSTAAFDYLLKPVTAERLTKTIERLQRQLRQPATDIDEFSQRLQTLQANAREPITPSSTPLKTIRAGRGDTVQMIPVEDVILFEAADKYVTVYTLDGEALIREPLRSLLQQLDPATFAQIHRSAIVNLRKVQSANKDDAGKVTLQLNGLDKQPTVSRMYRQLFQAM